MIPWHHERLDSDARGWAVEQLIAAAAATGAPAETRAEALRQAGERLCLVHGPAPSTPTERLEHLVGRLAQAAGRLTPTPAPLGAGRAWPAVGPVHGLCAERSPAPDALRAPPLGVDDQLVRGEWAFEAALVAARADGGPVDVVCSPVPGGLAGGDVEAATAWLARWWAARAVPIRQGVLLFNGARVRLGWRDAIGTFNPSFVTAVADPDGGFFPASRNEAAGACARRLTERGDVAVLVAEERARREVRAGFERAPTPARGQRGALRLGVWSAGQAEVCAGASALIVCGARHRGQPIDFEWLWRSIALLGEPGVHREALVLHAIEARQAQRRVIRDVELADALMARDAHPPIRSGVVQVLEAFGAELSPAVIERLRGGTGEDVWADVLAPMLDGAAGFRAALRAAYGHASGPRASALRATRAWRDAGHNAAVRALLEALCAPASPQAPG